jgi:histidinol-phosphate/aromatic aminotransferase/cobyric acid decarboxylase-like protein
MSSERSPDDAHALCVHGDVSPRELTALGVPASEVLDLSVNVNPLGPHPNVVRAVREAELARYPDRESSHARAAIAAACDEDPARVVLGHGSVELLWALVRVLAKRANKAGPLLIIGPTFSEPERAAHAHGVAVVRVDMHEHAQAVDDFALDTARISAAISQHAPCAVYLCHPNNPTGRALSAEALQTLLSVHEGTHFILDQAFLSLSEVHAQAELRFGDHVTCVRSLTKDHALAGLRVGYALCAPRLATQLEAERPPWLISSLAQAAIVAALAHPEHVSRSRELWLSAQHELHAGLMQLGLRVVPSATPYLLVRLGTQRGVRLEKAPLADLVRERLLREHRILVRSASSFGLPHHVRIAACFEPERTRLIAALTHVLSQGEGPSR